MHIFFSGIGGAGIGPLAQIALQAGYTVSGSDKQDSAYIDYLRKFGITDVHIGQSVEQIAGVHDRSPIDWFVYSSAVAMEQPDSAELRYCEEKNIRVSKRDELINKILIDKHLDLVAIAGTHGKTTTTAMTVWLFKQIGWPISYLLPAKVSFGNMGHFELGSRTFVYEADEFDRNFLAFHPTISLITGVTWDHHEIFPTREEYQNAFRDFVSQSQQVVLWEEDNSYLGLTEADNRLILDPEDEELEEITLPGEFNRRDAWLAVQAVHSLTDKPIEDLVAHVDNFPGLQRRMEEIIPGLYSDYAHTPEKIRGGMSVALEMAQAADKELVVIYEPLTNRRQHYMLDDYKDCFTGAKKVYWIPSYLAREDPNQEVLEPSELVKHLDDPSIAEATSRDETLKQRIQEHLDAGNMVVGMAGGGGGSLDDWLRKEFIHE